MTAELPLQGGRAVRSGRFGEATLEAGFGAYGVKIVNDDHVYHGADGGMWARRDQLLIRQYQGSYTIDFVYRDYSRDIVLPIECKQQMGSGTADHKLAYAVDLLVRSGFKSFWLVLSGGGFNPAVTKAIDDKIRNLPSGVNGRLIFNEGPFLQRAIEKLVERGKQ